MPICPTCRGAKMIPVGGVTPPYRPCPNCGGRGWISDAEAEERGRRFAEREKKKDKGFGVMMILLGLGLLYGGARSAGNSTAVLVFIVLAIICWTIGAKNL